MRPPSRNSGITMPATDTMVNPHPSSPSTDKETRDASNHGNAPSPIQTASNQDSWLSARTTTLMSPNAIHSHEITNNDPNPTFGLHLLSDAAIKHDQGLNKPQGYSDTNKADAPTRKTSSQAPVIFIEKKTLQHNSPPSNSEESKTYVCDYIINTVNGRICNKQLLGTAELTEHMKIHTKKNSFICSYCNKAFSHKGNFNQHLRTHTGAKPYTCKDCRKSFAKTDTLTRHLRIHSGDKSFLCEFCGKSFTRKDTLNTHLHTHTGDKSYLCEFCGKLFAQNKSLVQHIRTHTGKKPYTCKYCGKSFAQNVTLTYHQHTHTGYKPFVCVSCNQAFSKKHYLDKHIPRCHTAEEKTIPANAIEKRLHTAHP